MSVLNRTQPETHIAAALIEAGRVDLAKISFMNRGGQPAMRWCALGRKPNIGDVLVASKAFGMWYSYFRPDHRINFSPEKVVLWLEIILGGDPHPDDCPHCGGKQYQPLNQT